MNHGTAPRAEHGMAPLPMTLFRLYTCMCSGPHSALVLLACQPRTVVIWEVGLLLRRVLALHLSRYFRIPLGPHSVFRPGMYARQINKETRTEILRSKCAANTLQTSTIVLASALPNVQHCYRPAPTAARLESPYVQGGAKMLRASGLDVDDQRETGGTHSAQLLMPLLRSC